MSIEFDIHARLELFDDIEPLLRDTGSDYSPVGTDTGFDVLHSYESWRQRGKSRHTFLKKLLKDWGVSEGGTLYPSMHDDINIAHAFSQFYIDHRITAGIRSKALKAVESQSADENVASWTSPATRKDTLARMKKFLESELYSWKPTEDAKKVDVLGVYNPYSWLELHEEMPLFFRGIDNEMCPLGSDIGYDVLNSLRLCSNWSSPKNMDS